MNRMGEQSMMSQIGLAWAVCVGGDEQDVLLFTARDRTLLNSNMVTTQHSRQAEAETWMGSPQLG